MSLKKTWRKLFVLAIAGFLFFGTSCTLVDAISSSIDTSQTNSEPTYEGVQYDIYLLAVNSGYDGTYEEWLASIRGEDGQSIELRLDEESGWMQWKYANEDDNSWRNLIEIESLIGPQGPKGDTGNTGTNGITPHIGENGNWWIGDIDTGISATGPQGESGSDGQDGTNGITPHIGENGNWWVGSTDTGVKATGATGQTGETGATGNGIASIELISTVGNVDTYQITFTDGTTFTYVVTNGIDGTNGSDGQDGTNGITPHIGENGNWWIGDIDTGIDANGIQGETGAPGQDGQDGQSAYELYIENYPDYEGDEQQWLDDLINGNLGTKVYFTVTFDSNGGTIVDSQQVEDGRKATRPDEPTRTGYTFDGWYSYGDEKWVFSGYDVTENITLIAQWTANEYVVTFDAGLGTLTSYTETYTYDSEFTLPTPILEDNYFMGWYLDEQLVESGVWNIDENVTLTAYFIQEKYDVYYDYGYDFIEEVVEASYGQPFTPITPTRTGHTFEGWYDSDNNLYTGDATWNRESDLHLVALWSANDYTITLDLNGGVYSGELEYLLTYGEYFNLPVPTSSEGSFNGWYYNGVKLTDKYGKSLEAYLFDEDVTLTAVYYIEVSTVEDLLNISNDLEATYRLVNDIELSEVEWVPIGTETNPFKGKFEGGGFTISGLTITTPHDYIGLFNYSTGLIKDLNLAEVNINVTGNISQVVYAGALVGYNKGQVENIRTLSGTIKLKIRSGVQGYLGGVIGYNEMPNDALLKNIENSLTVSGDLTTYTGGVVAYNKNSILLDNVANTANVKSNNHNVGGLVGYNGLMKTFSITSSSNSGNVSGNNYVGGFIGSFDYDLYSTIKTEVTITNSYNGGTISGNWVVGGLVADAHYSITIKIISSYNIGAVSGGVNQVGGLVGSGSSTITNSFNSGAISGSVDVGGLVGYGSSTITNSFNSGAVSGRMSEVGGLVGSGFSTITNSFNSGAISGSDEVGGLVGDGGGTITNSFNSGAISGSAEVGGLVGYGYEGIIINSSNSGTVSGSYNVGGLVGYGSSVYIYYSINFGDVKATSNTTFVGGLIGFNTVNKDVEDSYFTGKVIANNVEVDGILFGERIDVSLLDEAFFLEVLGWDPLVWDLSTINISNGVYPVLIIPENI